MANNKNNGLFEKIRKTIDKESAATVLPETFNIPDLDDVGQSVEKLQSGIEQRLLKRFSKEKLQFAEELAAKYKTESIKKIKQQEQKIKVKFAEEHQKLKTQFEAAAKELINKREKELINKFKKQIAVLEENSSEELTAKIAKLQRQLANKKKELELRNQEMQQAITEAKITARKEQEKSSRALYEDLMQASHAELVASIEKKYQDEVAVLQQEHLQAQETKIQAALAEQKQKLLELHELELTQTRKAMIAEHENLIATIQEENLIALKGKEREIREACDQTAMLAQQAILTNALAQQEQNLYAAHQQQIEQLVSKLQAEHEEKLQLALMQERQQITEQLSSKLQAEQEEKLQLALIQERLQITQQITEQLNGKLQAEQEEKLQQALAQERLQITEQLNGKLQAEHDEKLQQALAQERLQITEQIIKENQSLLQKQEQELQEKFAQEKLQLQEQFENEKYTFLQQQQSIVRAQFENEKNIFLQHQESIIRAQFDSDKESLLEEQKLILLKQFAAEKKALLQQMSEQQTAMASEQNLRLAQLQQELISKHQLEIASLEDKLRHNVFSQSQQPSEHIGAKHIEILHNREQSLKEQFAEELEQARRAWELQQQSVIGEQQKIQAQLREELTIAKRLNEQLQIQFVTKQDNQEAALRTQHSLQLQQQQEMLQAQFTLQLQQQKRDAALELENLQEEMAEYHEEQLNMAIAKNSMQIREQYDEELSTVTDELEEKCRTLLEQERKKIQQQFAHDKAILVRDLTARFEREKQITMEQYETELRDKLYKEMVKQKEYIQHKFTSTQQAALQEQKRRLDAEHRHEVERIKKGFFNPEPNQNLHNQIVIERNVEHMADRILSKFKSPEK